jgi:hypothetical protein
MSHFQSETSAVVHGLVFVIQLLKYFDTDKVEVTWQRQGGSLLELCILMYDKE